MTELEKYFRGDLCDDVRKVLTPSVGFKTRTAVVRNVVALEIYIVAGHIVQGRDLMLTNDVSLIRGNADLFVT